MNKLASNNNDLLIEECRKGSKQAQFRLYNHYSKAMYNLAYRFMNNREDAEDMLQEAFTECFRNIRSYRCESTFGAWLKSILINTCINNLKKKKVILMFTDNLPENADDASNAFYGNDDSYTHCSAEKIFRGIEKLPDGYRIILTLYLLEGYDHSEISRILAVSESTSKSQYCRAKEKLRQILKKE